VPTPMVPFANIVKSVVVEVPPVVEAMVRKGVFTAVLTEFEIDNSEFGVLVPMPT